MTYLDLQWFDKPACRLPEAYWMSFVPCSKPSGAWLFDKLGEPVSPTDVVLRGGRWLHAVGDGAYYEDSLGSFRLTTLDAALIAPGKPSLLDFDMDHAPDLSGGVHVNLYNNIYGTNFPMWFQGSSRFRFRIDIGDQE